MEQACFPGTPLKNKRHYKRRACPRRVDSRSPSPYPPFTPSEWDLSGEFWMKVTLGDRIVGKVELASDYKFE